MNKEFMNKEFMNKEFMNKEFMNKEILSEREWMKLDERISKYTDISHYKLQTLMNKIDTLKRRCVDKKTNKEYLEMYDKLFNNLSRIRGIIIDYYIKLSEKKDAKNENIRIKDKKFIREYNNIIDILYSKMYHKKVVYYDE